MKTIVFVTSAMAKGGAERVISILSNDYAKEGWKVQIVLLLHNIVQYELNPSIIVENISDDSKSPIKNAPILILKLRRIFKRINPDVVISFMDSAIITEAASIGLKIKKVTSERIDPSAAKRNKYYQKILYHAYSASDLIVLQTQRAKKYFANKLHTKSVVIANPIVVTDQVCTSRKHKIVTAGRLKPQKNHKMLIDAFYEIYKKHPEYSLIIYGEGELRNSLEEQIRIFGLEKAVLLPGNSDHLHQEIKDAEMFVLSSDYEGLSNALMEAMMMGLPCISTNCSGSDELIDNGLNGLIVPIGNCRALKDAMMFYIENPKKREAIASSGRKKAVSEYSYESVISTWKNCINSIMNNYGEN